MSSGSTRCGGRGSAARRRASVLMPMRCSIELGLVLGDGVLERDVAGREPHLLVAAFVLPAGFVAGVGLEQAPAEVVHRGAARRRRRRPRAARGSRCGGCTRRSLRRCRCGSASRRSAGSRPPRGGTSPARRSGTARATSRAAGRGAACRTARACAGCHALIAGHAVLRAGRDVAAVGVEPAVTTHPARDERLGERMALEELGLGVLELIGHRLIRHAAPFRERRPTVYSRVYRRQQKVLRVLRASC